MKIHPCNNSTSFQAKLKIYTYVNSHSPISGQEIKNVENGFAELTKSQKGNLDVILYDRYNSAFAKADRILYSEGEYMDYVDTYFKHVIDSNELTKKLVSIFEEFKKIKQQKENMKTMF